MGLLFFERRICRNNYLRLCILTASKECRGSLEKLTVSDDVIKNLMPLASGNDPAARGLMLR